MGQGKSRRIRSNVNGEPTADARSPSSRFRAAACAAFLFLLSLVSVACRPTRQTVTAGHKEIVVASAPLPRANPAYLQWLERQSMLNSAMRLTSGISGSPVLWRNSAVASRANTLLEAAPNWLDLNPHLHVFKRNLFGDVGSSDFFDFLTSMGVSGIYVSPGGERADIWTTAKTTSKRDVYGPWQAGDNVASLLFDHSLGAEEEYEKLLENLEGHRMQLGGDILPAATGLGPDFMLQARQASRFDGIYAMTPVPQKYWNLLPDSNSDWDCKPLSDEMARNLADAGLLPSTLTRDRLVWTSPGGWAATGEVHGADGQARRWLYRYAGHVFRPVLLWQDPSGNARRIFSASAIQHTGLRRQALAGVRLEPLMGFDVDSGTHVDSVPYRGQWEGLTPGPEALKGMAQEIHRYGGWSMQADVLPLSLTRDVLADAADFARDAATWPAVVYALLSGDVGPLTTLLRGALAAGIEQGRLVRGLHEGLYVDWRPFLDMPGGMDMIRKAQYLLGGAAGAMGSRISAASLASRVLRAGADSPLRESDGQALRQACFTLLSWRMGLPGLVFVSPQDLTGMLSSESPDQDAPADAMPLWGGASPSSTRRKNFVFGDMQSQQADSASFLRLVGTLLQARRQSGLYKGDLEAVTRGPAGCLAVVSRLPDKGRWVLASNFTRERQNFSLRLSQGIGAQNARDAVSGEVLSVQDNRLEVRLDARQSRHLLLF
jgi:hypothetical protein